MSIASTASLCYFNDSVGVPPEKIRSQRLIACFREVPGKGKVLACPQGMSFVSY